MQKRSRNLPSSTALLFAALAACSALACTASDDGQADSETTESPEQIASVTQKFSSGSITEIPNNLPILNMGGLGATYSTTGSVELDTAFQTPQGTNGRSCGSCHLPQAGWSIRPIDIELMFLFTDGTHPIFNPLDANTPTSDVSTVEARRASYSMLRKGLFRRGGTLPATREFDIVAADDPYGYGSTTRFSVFRRGMATANFQFAKNVGWDDGNTVAGDVHASLFNQARGNITGGQQGATPLPETVESIVAYESALSFAQVIVPHAGNLEACGGKGGAENLANQPNVAGPFNLYSAWATGNCGKAKGRASIARGQALFNTKTNAAGRTCIGCHNGENTGVNTNGIVFNIGASDARWRTPDLPLYTVVNRATGETIQTTDPGKANRSGKWSDMNKFKIPALRGLAARAPYFHNGIAKDLPAVVHFYEESQGFDFSPSEEDDLVAFMNAL